MNKQERRDIVLLPISKIQTKWFSDARLKEDIQFYEERNGVNSTLGSNAEAKRLVQICPTFGVIAQKFARSNLKQSKRPLWLLYRGMK